MGNENDKRLTKSRQVNNNDNNNKNNNSGARNQQTPAQNINLNQNQNERINPYDKNQMGGTNSNNNIPRINRPELGGARNSCNSFLDNKKKKYSYFKNVKRCF